MAGLSLQTQPKKPTVQWFMNPCGFPEEVARIVDQYIIQHRITLLYSTTNSIRYEIATGIPHPDEPCSLMTEQHENRTYVRQKGASYLESRLDNAFQMIRFPIGSRPSANLQEERRRELACSQYHVEYAEYMEWTTANEWPQLDQMINYPSPVPITRESQRNQNAQNDAQGIPVPPFLRQFAAVEQTQFSHLRDFLRWYKKEKTIDLHVRFIQSQQYTVNSAIDLITDCDGDSDVKGNSPDEYYANQLRLAITVIQATKLYQLAPSTWKPNQTFEQLLTELKEKGPLVIRGDFATSQRQETKLIAESTADQEVFEWVERATISTEDALTVVGAQKERNKNYVYYVDPSEESDPATLMKRRLYKISYRCIQIYAHRFSRDVYAYSRTQNVKTKCEQ